MGLGRDNLRLVFSNNTTCFSGEDILTGEAQISIENTRGLKVYHISLIFDCSVLVRVPGSINCDVTKQGPKHFKKSLLKKEYSLCAGNTNLASGINKVPFEIEIPKEASSLPPNCLDKINEETRAQIRHSFKIVVQPIKDPNILVSSARYNINIIPKSIIPREFHTEELGFMTHISRYGGGKVTGKISSVASTSDLCQHKINSVGMNSDMKFLTGLVKTVSGKRNSKIPLICMLSVPREGIKQDGSSRFTLRIHGLNDNDTFMMRSLSLCIKTVSIVKMGYDHSDNVVETTPVYQKILINKGNVLEVSGEIMMQNSILPSFETLLLSHFHYLELKAEISRIDCSRVYEPTILIESVPVKVLSYLHDTNKINDIPEANFRNHISPLNNFDENNTGLRKAKSSTSSTSLSFSKSSSPSPSYSPISFTTDDTDNTSWDYKIFNPEEFLKSKLFSWF